MVHAIYRVIGYEIVGPYTLRVDFDDGTSQTIDFCPILAGELYAPLLDREVFDRVSIDPEVHTLIWPNGADFDPATLHDWPRYADAMRKRAQSWRSSGQRTGASA